MTEIDTINHFTPRFASKEDALAFQRTRDYRLRIPRYVFKSGAYHPNQAYIDAPFEEVILPINPGQSTIPKQ